MDSGAPTRPRPAALPLAHRVPAAAPARPSQAARAVPTSPGSHLHATDPVFARVCGANEPRGSAAAERPACGNRADAALRPTPPPSAHPPPPARPCQRKGRPRRFRPRLFPEVQRASSRPSPRRPRPGCPEAPAHPWRPAAHLRRTLSPHPTGILGDRKAHHPDCTMGALPILLKSGGWGLGVGATCQPLSLAYLLGV